MFLLWHTVEANCAISTKHTQLVGIFSEYENWHFASLYQELTIVDIELTFVIESLSLQYD